MDDKTRARLLALAERWERQSDEAAAETTRLGLSDAQVAHLISMAQQLAACASELREEAGEGEEREKPPSITCPTCRKTSYHPKDIEERYCGYCHQWHENMRAWEGEKR